MIIKTPWAFYEEYLPPEIIDRESERSMLRMFLSPLLTGQPLLQSMFVTGTVGVGKTALTKFILRDLPSAGIYFKLSEADSSLPRILYKIIVALGIPIPAYTYSNIVLMKLIQWFNDQKKTSLLVLDDFEKIPLKAIRPLLHDIPRETPWCNFLIISRLPAALEGLPADTKSTLRCRELALPPYNKETIFQILKQRVTLALQENAMDDKLLELIAKDCESYGSSRAAIEILQMSCRLADQFNEDKVTQNDVEIAIDMIDKRSLEETIKDLPPYHKLILKCLNNQPQEYSNIYHIWKFSLSENGLKNLSIYRFRDFISDLKKYELIEIERRGRGRGCGIKHSLFLRPEIYKLVKGGIVKNE